MSGRTPIPQTTSIFVVGFFFAKAERASPTQSLSSRPLTNRQCQCPANINPAQVATTRQLVSMGMPRLAARGATVSTDSESFSFFFGGSAMIYPIVRFVPGPNTCTQVNELSLRLRMTRTGTHSGQAFRSQDTCLVEPRASFFCVRFRVANQVYGILEGGVILRDDASAEKGKQSEPGYSADRQKHRLALPRMWQRRLPTTPCFYSPIQAQRKRECKHFTTALLQGRSSIHPFCQPTNICAQGRDCFQRVDGIVGKLATFCGD